MKTISRNFPICRLRLVRSLVLSLPLGLALSLVSCDSSSNHPIEEVEVWQTVLIEMESSSGHTLITHEEYPQYLTLFPDGKAFLDTHLENGNVNHNETSWEIKKYKGKVVFGFGFGMEDQGVKGVALPIIKKDETDFLMAFDTTGEYHAWNLKRVE